jgi:hypothetical protein
MPDQQKPARHSTVILNVLKGVLLSAAISSEAFAQDKTGVETDSSRLSAFKVLELKPGISLLAAIKTLIATSPIAAVRNDDCKDELEEMSLSMCLKIASNQVMKLSIVPDYRSWTGPVVSVPEMIDKTTGTTKREYMDMLTVYKIKTIQYLTGDTPEEGMEQQVTQKFGVPSRWNYGRNYFGLLYSARLISNRHEPSFAYPGNFLQFYADYAYQCGDDNVIVKCFAVEMSGRGGSTTNDPRTTRFTITLDDGELYYDLLKSATAAFAPVKMQRAGKAASGLRF